MSNLLEILNRSIDYLTKKEIAKPRLTAETVIAEVIGIDRIMIYANFELIVTEEQKTLIRDKINDIVKLIQTTNQLEIKEDKSEIKEKEDILKTIMDKSISYLEKNDINEAKLIAEIIFAHVLKIDRMMIFTRYKDTLTKEQIDKARNIIQKVARDKFPIQYILNEQEFYGRSFYVDKGVLIPRQDTEVLVEKAISILKNIKEPKVLDIGVGTGIIGITISLEVENTKVMGVDISGKALEIAEKNKKIHNAKNIKFIESNLFENIEYKSFDMIVSNPPYIDKNDIKLMSDDTLLHEPYEALFAENEGLYFYYEISERAKDYMSDGAYLIFEVGYNQSILVERIMNELGYKNVVTVNDLNEIGRVVIGQKNGADK